MLRVLLSHTDEETLSLALALLSILLSGQLKVKYEGQYQYGIYNGREVDLH